jgi:hypothetical protein
MLSQVPPYAVGAACAACAAVPAVEQVANVSVQFGEAGS